MPMPTASTAQIVAAVVIPFTRLSPRNITPAPKKPMPVAILDAMRFELFAAPITIDIIVKKQESIDIIIIIQKPADLLLYCLSAPTIPPHRAASKKDASIS